MFPWLIVRSDYKNKKDWIKYDYDLVVTPSDEAFVWQVMTFYYPVWSDEKSEHPACDRKGGPKKGFTNTTGKTMKTYEKYLQAVGSSRDAINSKLWSRRLKFLARKQEKEDRLRDGLENNSAVSNGVEVAQDTPDTGFLRYAKLRMCGFDKVGNDDDDDNTNESFVSSSVESMLTEEV